MAGTREALVMLLGLSLAACDSGGGGGDEASGSSTGEPQTTSESSTSTGAPDTETSGSGSDTDTETSGPDTDTDTDTDTGGQEIPAECTAADPETDAAYDLVPEAWDEIDRSGADYAWYDVEETCTVESVDVADGLWVTRLNCGGEPARIATLSVAAPPSGFPSWSADQSLTFDALGRVDDFGGYERIRLSAGEDELLHVVRGDALDFGEAGLVSSIGAEASHEECDAPPLDDYDADETGPLALHFEQGEQSMTIISGHRGAFDLGDGRALEIDVQEATSGHCCSSSISLHVLKRVSAAE